MDETPIAVQDALQQLNAAQTNLVATAGSLKAATRARQDAQDAEVSATRNHGEAKTQRDAARTQLNAALDQAYGDLQVTPETAALRAA